jgi:hypothetical protein
VGWSGSGIEAIYRSRWYHHHHHGFGTQLARTEPDFFEDRLCPHARGRHTWKVLKGEPNVKIETVQRRVASVILVHVGGSPILALAVYSPMLVRTNHTSGVGLWMMSGVVGLTKRPWASF